MTEQFYTPPQAAEVLRVNTDKVLGWIHSGELAASNCAANPNGERPRWRIAGDDLGRFLLRRRHPASLTTEKKKRRAKPSKVVQYF